jgi:hypothetical protein
MNIKALRQRPLTTNTMVEVCSTIKGRPMHIRQGSGVALGNQATGEITYTPPEGETHLREQLANWEHFIHAEDTLDPLIKMAVAPDAIDCPKSIHTNSSNLFSSNRIAAFKTSSSVALPNARRHPSISSNSATSACSTSKARVKKSSSFTLNLFS